MSLSTSAVESVIVSTVLCVFNEVKETCFLSIFYISPDSLRLFFLILLFISIAFLGLKTSCY